MFGIKIKKSKIQKDLRRQDSHFFVLCIFLSFLLLNNLLVFLCVLYFPFVRSFLWVGLLFPTSSVRRCCLVSSFGWCCCSPSPVWWCCLPSPPLSRGAFSMSSVGWCCLVSSFNGWSCCFSISCSLVMLLDFFSLCSFFGWCCVSPLLLRGAAWLFPPSLGVVLPFFLLLFGGVVFPLLFADGSTWDVSKMTAQQWRLMPARRAQHGRKEATVCWLGEHAVSHHKLAVQFRRQSGRTDIVVLLEQTKQVCQCTLRSVTGKGDTEEQARKNAEELMTNVAKNFATGSIGRSDLFSYERSAQSWWMDEGGGGREAAP